MASRYRNLLLMGGMLSIEDATLAAQARGATSKVYHMADEGIKTGLSRKERRKQAAIERKDKSNDRN